MKIYKKNSHFSEPEILNKNYAVAETLTAIHAANPYFNGILKLIFISTKRPSKHHAAANFYIKNFKTIVSSEVLFSIHWKREIFFAAKKTLILIHNRNTILFQ